ncbi:MAG: prolipoprotein diacylglyceryl transferase [Clostridia bacterium]|nr:prolipoprotein diacylglyceryl transferase [Clostridia bacterium]
MYTSKISFPGLGIDEFLVKNVAFTIPGVDLPIMWYALIITFGMICCIFYVVMQAKKIGITLDDVIDYALFTIPIGVIGARLYYVIFDNEHTYETIIDVFNIRQGGLAIYGGIIAGTLTVVAVSYFKKINFFAFGDCVAPGVLLAQGIGRWGNFMNGEAFGSETTSFIRMGLQNFNTYGKLIYVHPTFLYESLWNLTGVLLVYLYAKLIHKKYDGQLILLTFGWYGLGRMFIEGLRTDSLYIGNTDIRVSQALAGLIFFTFLGMLIFFHFKKPKKALYNKPAPAQGEEKKSDVTFAKILDKIKGVFASKKVEKNIEDLEDRNIEEQNDEENQ